MTTPEPLSDEDLKDIALYLSKGDALNSVDALRLLDEHARLKEQARIALEYLTDSVDVESTPLHAINHAVEALSPDASTTETKDPPLCGDCGARKPTNFSDNDPCHECSTTETKRLSEYCYCSDRMSGGLPCPPWTCPNGPTTEAKR